jgi:hypothetical protein
MYTKKRKKVSKRYSKKNFRQVGSKTKAINQTTNYQFRGGIRL